MKLQTLPTHDYSSRLAQGIHLLLAFSFSNQRHLPFSCKYKIGYIIRQLRLSGRHAGTYYRPAVRGGGSYTCLTALRLVTISRPQILCQNIFEKMTGLRPITLSLHPKAFDRRLAPSAEGTERGFVYFQAEAGTNQASLHGN